MAKDAAAKQPKASYRYGYGMMGTGQHAGQQYKMVDMNGNEVGKYGGTQPAQTGPQTAPRTGFGGAMSSAGLKNMAQAAGVPVQAAPGTPQVPPGGAKPPTKAKANSTQNSLQIAEFREGIVIMNDGTFRAVIAAKAINFDLMSMGEQEGIEQAYQGFLNSLYFPIQIFIRSQKVDLQPYIERLDKIRAEHDNMLLALLMEDYISYIDSLSKETNIMDKQFYIVVPFATSKEMEAEFAGNKSFFQGIAKLFAPNEGRLTISEEQLDKAKTELRNRVQSVMQGLEQCGISSMPLDTKELISLYYDMYNPDTAIRQPIKNFEDLTADMITKGEGLAPQAHLQGDD